MDLFSALSDPTRRRIVELLARNGPLPATDIYASFPVSHPAISQHLKILREAKLVRVEKRAQQRIYHINPQAIQELEEWAMRMTLQWNQRFDALERVLAAEKQKAQANPTERTNRMETQPTKELTLTRVFDAPRELVWKAWTDPQLMAQWWGPTFFTTPVCELDVRPGGSILITMQDPDGVEYPMKGIFHEVIPLERLVFTAGAMEDAQGHFQFETSNTITFAELNGKTRLTLHVVVDRSTPAAETALAGMEAGWSQSLDKLAGIIKFS